MKTFASCLILLVMVVAAGCDSGNTATIPDGYESSTPVPEGSEPVGMGGGSEGSGAVTAPPLPNMGN